MMNDYEKIFVDRLERGGFTKKPKLFRVRHIVYQVISEMIDRYDGVLSKDVASMFEPYLYDGLSNILRYLRSIDGKVIGNWKGNAIKRISIEEAVGKVYGSYDKVEWSDRSKIIPLSSVILFSTDKGLEDFIRKYSSMKTVKVVECGFE